MDPAIARSDAAPSPEKDFLAGLTLQVKSLTQLLSAKDLLLTIRSLPAENRLELLSSFFSLSAEKQALDQFFRHKIPNLLNWTTVSERVDLIKNLLAQEPSPNGAAFIARLLGVSKDLAELEDVVNKVGSKNLLAIKNKRVTDLVAKAVLFPEMRELEPFSPPTSMNRKSIVKSLKNIVSEVEERLKILEKYPEFKRTLTVKQFKKIADENCDYVEAEAYRLANENWSPVGRVFKKLLGFFTKVSGQEDEYFELASLLSSKMNLEFSYGIRLTNETDAEGKNVRKWRSSNMTDTKLTFAEIPEGKLLFTPQLTEIRRVSIIDGDETKLGQRDANTIILIADGAFDNKEILTEYEEIPSFQMVLSHELGHSINFGNSGAVIRFNRHNHIIFGPSDPTYDFERWCELSGWITFERGSYKYVHGNQAVRLDGHDYPIGVPVVYNGQTVMFIRDTVERALYAYDTRFRFSLQTYSRESPWEDWAEAFSEYIQPKLVPRLIKFALPKFAYFEDHFRKYEGDTEITALVAEATKSAH